MACTAFRRLSKLCRPIRYAIELKPCMDSLKFTGKQSVTLEMLEGASEIELNARNITVHSAKFNGVDIEVIPEPEAEIIRFSLGKPSITGHAVLDLEFDGLISEKMVGLYRSNYEENDQKKTMLATQFEPSNARHSFPCWDEPEFKSIFSIKLIVPKDLDAISNMPLVSKLDLDGDYVAYSFDDTPKMSSYLVAFVIGELEYVEARDANNVLVRVYSRRGFVTEAGRGDLALDIACRSLPFFGDYFGVDYPLPKVDLVAIPDFAGGAMENWGLVTFRERTLLVEKESAAPATKQSIALTVSHELAHMWFGNLVTMRWWTDLWLKEGFANWIEYLCVNFCFPEMDIWAHFTYAELASALRLDALNSSHPIEIEVNSPDEVEEIFDHISYCKGASLIRMLHAYLGETAFRTGLRSYLRQYAYSNATTDDLWNALTEEPSSQQHHLAQVMRPWTRSTGFPVVTVQPLEIVPEVGGNGSLLQVKLHQTPYRLPGKNKSEDDNKMWPVPIVITCTSSQDPSEESTVVHRHLLTTDSETVSVQLPSSISWSSLSDCAVLVNADAAGFYHVRYPDISQLRLFAGKKHFPTWSTAARFAFVNDGFALAKAGFIRINDWLDILPELLQNETSYSIWRCVLVSGFATYIRRIVHESGVIPIQLYHNMLKKLTLPALEKLGFLNPSPDAVEVVRSHNTSLLCSLLISTAGAEAGDLGVIEEARRRYEAHESGKQTLPGDLRAAIYSTVIRHGTAETVEQFIKAYRATKSPDERSHILGALGGASHLLDIHKPSSCLNGTSVRNDVGDQSEPPLCQVLAFCLDPRGPVRDQDRLHGLAACASWSSAARLISWELVKSQWDRICDMYQGQFLLSSLIQSMLSGFAAPERYIEVKAFFDSHPVSCPRTVQQALETMEVNQMLVIRDAPLIAELLTSYNGIHSE